MVYRVIYTQSSEKDLSRLDKKQAVKVLQKVDNFLKLKNPLSMAKKLKGFALDTFRFRIGDYRVIFRLDKESGNMVVLVVLKIAHRKDVYRL